MSIDSSRIGTASFYRKAMRILKLAKKPDRSEVLMVVKITAVGMILLGLVAYIIRLILYGILQQPL